ncbi:hypothetical protein V8C42DRAFT_321751 [Trichoderma barbatum]
METVIEESPQPSQLPEFDASFQDTAATCYFHHIIDVAAATLRVEVLGPNLAYTFRHERAKELRLPASSICKRLEGKVTGFLALRTGTDQRRVVVAWAQSGHGIGLKGDLLDPDPSVLPNDLWTKRAITVGRALCLKMGRPYDGRVFQTTGVKMEGIFQGSHVEVKLAVHAICILLSSFGITQDLDHVSPEHLRALRQAAWNDGSKPEFEIYFSRKNCHFCGKFVRRLQRATGITLKLMWRDRLVKKVYEIRPMTKANEANRPQQPREAIHIDADTVMTDDVHVIETIDLSGDLPVVAEIVNLTDDCNSNNSDSPPPEQDQNRRANADAYIEGLAYCVGQIDECPASARDAILTFAAQQQRRAVNVENINKPLPATPQIAPPGYATAVSAELEDEDLETVEAILMNPLLTPPSSGSRQHARVNRGKPRASQAPRVRTEQITPSRPPSHHSTNLRVFYRSPTSSTWIERPSRRCSDSPDPF